MKKSPLIPFNLRPLAPSVFSDPIIPSSTSSCSPWGGRLLLGHTTCPAPPVTKGMQYLQDAFSNLSSPRTKTPVNPSSGGYMAHYRRSSFTSECLREVVKITKYVRVPQTPKVTLGLVPSIKCSNSQGHSTSPAWVPSESIKRVDEEPAFSHNFDSN